MTTLDVDVDVVGRMDAHRAELRAHCRTMLGSVTEAEDAAQEALVRAWRAYDRFEGRASLRTWLYRIATNVCLDMIDARRRRPEPAELTTGESTEHSEWPPPAPVGAATSPAEDDPAERAVARDSVRLAFAAALLTLPPRQRSVLVLRDVLRWRATEVAELLGTTVPSVQSALQRARATLAAHHPAGDLRTDPLDGAQRALLRCCTDAFERCDVATLVAALS